MNDHVGEVASKQEVTPEYVHVSATQRANDAELLARLAWSTTLMITGLGIFLGDVLNVAWLAGVFLLIAGFIVLFRWRIQKSVYEPFLCWWRS